MLRALFDPTYDEPDLLVGDGADLGHVPCRVCRPGDAVFHVEGVALKIIKHAPIQRRAVAPVVAAAIAHNGAIRLNDGVDLGGEAHRLGRLAAVFAFGRAVIDAGCYRSSQQCACTGQHQPEGFWGSHAKS